MPCNVKGLNSVLVVYMNEMSPAQMLMRKMICHHSTVSPHVGPL